MFDNLDNQPQDELSSLLSQFQPGELHQNLQAVGRDSETNKDRMGMMLALLKAGMPMDEIPTNDFEALKALYDDKILGIQAGQFSPEENETFQNLLSSSQKQEKFASIIDSLDSKGHVDLADDVEKIAKLVLSYDLSNKYAFMPEMETSYLSGEPQPIALPQEQQQLEEQLEPEISDEEIEDEIAPKDIDGLLNKLEAIMDAMSDEFDPDLLPIAQKIAREIVEKLEKINVFPEEETIPEEVMPEEEIPQEQAPIEPSLAPGTPAIASILRSTIKLAQTAEDLENTQYNNISEGIDDLILDVQKLIRVSQTTPGNVNQDISLYNAGYNAFNKDIMPDQALKYHQNMAHNQYKRTNPTLGFDPNSTYQQQKAITWYQQKVGEFDQYLKNPNITPQQRQQAEQAKYQVMLQAKAIRNNIGIGGGADLNQYYNQQVKT